LVNCYCYVIYYNLNSLYNSSIDPHHLNIYYMYIQIQIILLSMSDFSQFPQSAIHSQNKQILISNHQTPPPK
jgi:hypothetical protein